MIYPCCYVRKLRNWQTIRKHTPFTGYAVYCHLIIMGLNDVLDECQPQTGLNLCRSRILGKQCLVQVDCMTLDAPQGNSHIAEG